MTTPQIIVDKLRGLEQAAQDIVGQPVKDCQENCKRNYVPMGISDKYCAMVLEKRLLTTNDEDTNYCASECPYRQLLKSGGN
jgi:hypothetical protein